MARGNFDHLNKAGLEFWNLIHQERELTPEEQIDEMIDEELYNKRRFSRVISCEGQVTSPVLLKRAISFGRQVSKSSQCTFGESTATVAADVNQTVVYVRQKFSEESIIR